MKEENRFKDTRNSRIFNFVFLIVLIILTLFTLVTLREKIQKEVVDPDGKDEMLDFTIDTTIVQDSDPQSEEDAMVSALTELMSEVSSPVVMSSRIPARRPAVMEALKWLRKVQNPDGSWNATGAPGGEENVGYTGLALLAFLAHGETPASAEFGDTVAKGIRFLVEHQDSQGVFRPSGPHPFYGHAVALYALAEACNMIEHPLLRESVARGVHAMQKEMQAPGVFDAEIKKENRNEFNSGIWRLQALKSASRALDQDPEVEKLLQQTMEEMLTRSRKSPDGGRYFIGLVGREGEEDGTPDKILTAAGTLGLYISGRGRSQEARECIQFLKAYTQHDRLPQWGNMEVGAESGGEIMFWYFMANTFFQEGPDGENFRRYMPAVVKALVLNQADDGHWECDTRSGKQTVAVLNTSLGALTLMVIYPNSIFR